MRTPGWATCLTKGSLDAATGRAWLARRAVSPSRKRGETALVIQTD